MTYVLTAVTLPFAPPTHQHRSNCHWPPELCPDEKTEEPKGSSKELRRVLGLKSSSQEFLASTDTDLSCKSVASTWLLGYVESLLHTPIKELILKSTASNQGRR